MMSGGNRRETPSQNKFSVCLSPNDFINFSPFPLRIVTRHVSNDNIAHN